MVLSEEIHYQQSVFIYIDILYVCMCIYIYLSIYIYIFLYLYIYIYGVAIKIVQDHCSIAEALLSDVCTKHCRAIGPPPKATMAQNTGKRYGPKKNDNHDHSNCLDETDFDGNLYIFTVYTYNTYINIYIYIHIYFQYNTHTYI